MDQFLFLAGSIFVLSWERHLAGFPHLGVEDRWLATPKRARIAHCSLSRNRRINMQLTNLLTNSFPPLEPLP